MDDEFEYDIAFSIRAGKDLKNIRPLSFRKNLRIDRQEGVEPDFPGTRNP